MDGPRHGQKGVLLVEDDPCVRAALTDVLADEGYAVTPASNGYTALRLAARAQPDVILLDLALPELSGQAVLRALKQDEATRDIPVVVVSGRADAVGAAGLELADLVLVKPLNLPELLMTLLRMTSRARRLGPRVPRATATVAGRWPHVQARLRAAAARRRGRRTS
jgi:twitching motility two-component system response regulator PilH